MNSLSWLIYFAQIVGSLSNWAVFSAVVSAGAGMATVAYGAIERENAYYTNDRKRQGLEENPRWQAAVRVQRKAIYAVPVVLFFALLSTLLPSRETFLMIAASEMGGTVVKTPEAQEIFLDLKTILKQQLQALKKAT